MTENWPACGRVAHLWGGAIATNQPRSASVVLWPSTLDGEKAEISLSTYQGFYTDIHALGCHIIGVDFYTSERQVVGVYPPEWRSCGLPKGSWINWEARQKWSEIAFHSAKSKNGLLFDLSNRIRYQLATVSEQLRHLSCTYQDQLRGKTVKGGFKPLVKFEDEFTKKIYIGFHSFLFDSCILRDYLAEFVYNYSENGSRKVDGMKVTTAAGLIKKVLKKLKSQPNIVEQEFISITSEDGWLFKLGAYRDLVMHAAPIAIARRKLFALCDTIDLLQDRKLPVIRCPLPQDPSLIARIRATRAEFNHYIDIFEEFKKASDGEIAEFDCLQYAQMASAQLADLSYKVMSLAPISPQEIHLTEEDITDLRILND